ncbi:MAG: hypothetical protein RBS36_04315 [Thiomicrospira sp.]|jgi:hypothetical protein|nr:hypothetical protein [Thiomicrospira sp.]
MKKQKPSYRDLEREIARLRAEYKPAIDAFRYSTETVLHEVTEETAHALLGQAVLEQIVKDIAYKKITAGEAKLWLETKWHKRHDIEGTHKEQCDFLGIDPDDLNDAFNEIDNYVNQSTGDRAIKLFMLELDKNKGKAA